MYNTEAQRTLIVHENNSGHGKHSVKTIKEVTKEDLLPTIIQIY